MVHCPPGRAQPTLVNPVVRDRSGKRVNQPLTHRLHKRDLDRRGATTMDVPRMYISNHHVPPTENMRIENLYMTTGHQRNPHHTVEQWKDLIFKAVVMYKIKIDKKTFLSCPLHGVQSIAQDFDHDNQIIGSTRHQKPITSTDDESIIHWENVWL